MRDVASACTAQPSGRRRFVRLVGFGALALAAVSMVANALTIESRWLPAPESEAAPEIATYSWLVAGLCSVVLLGALARRLAASRRPGMRLLWAGGLLAATCTYVVHMATASLWV